jgi:hypothetical protein
MQRYTLPVCFCLTFIFCTFGCTPAAKKAAETVPVKGTVNLDDKPMADGEIWFSVPGETVNNLTIKNGAYSGNAHPGKNKVEIYQYKEGPPLTTDPDKKATKVNTLPAKYSGTESKLDANVTKGGPNDFKFDISTK